jgi:hypothetical protein
MGQDLHLDCTSVVASVVVVNKQVVKASTFQAYASISPLSNFLSTCRPFSILCYERYR